MEARGACACLKDLVSRWGVHDWRASEARINRHPQILTRIAGQHIHSLHVRSPRSDDGWSPHRVAAAYVDLMDRLGYETFAVQGGDYGALVAVEIARAVPNRLLGMHIRGSLAFPEGLDAGQVAAFSLLERDRLRRIQAFAVSESGYISIQSTRPWGIGAMAADSPLATLAWMYDKLQGWTHPPRERRRRRARASFRVRQRVSVPVHQWCWLRGRCRVRTVVRGSRTTCAPATPVGVISFAHDVAIRAFHDRQFNTARWTDVPDRGGHFAALEEPSRVVADIRDFFRVCRAPAAPTR
ncbi:epoxide hydrolase N-terminal domain-containing protein [Leucobacter sp. BZR 635]